MAHTSVDPSFRPVSPQVNFPELEQHVLTYWDKSQSFRASIQSRPEDKPYSFYDGPPFATGLPHYGHLLAGTIKDIVPRYWTMQGYRVERQFGWDCHGVPVEFEINKSLDLHSRKDILNYGVKNYNQACRSIVDRYSQEWKKTVRRMGRWVDMDRPYYTMDLSFMESVWGVFQSLYDKGLIYEGLKVVPYSTGISTVLSNFEANLDYRDVQDPAITVTFPLSDGPSVLAWTTTPWTLPSNLGLAVHRDVDYVEFKDLTRKDDVTPTYIMAQARLSSYFKSESDFEVIKTFKGEALLGKTYTPLFGYFSHLKNQNAFRIIHSDHVTTESGSGVVHMAPAFGEDDFFACKAHHMPIVNPVDDDGVFTQEVPDFEGKKVKEADKDIIARIKSDGRLYKNDTLVHSYPFCYRSGTPLIYRAVSSWFVSVEKIKNDIIAANQETSWVPDHLKNGRFGKWLENARDWAISRNRFWGTPIPIWKNNQGEMMCVGSKDELERLSGVKVNDLHKEFVDEITIPSPTGKDPLRRVDQILDCWFESGSMPYAQKNQAFPADFIAEGLDQTRGWFYTLMVIGAALHKKAPFKNVIVNGIIVAEDGKKMSKSLRNYPDPEKILNEVGADALRLYLIDSPVVKAEELRFSDKGVRDVVRRILLRWWNAYSFFVNYANVDHFRPRGDYAQTPNLLDRWILSRLNRLILNTNREMKAYRLYAVVPELLDFIESLTNTYIRFNRPHFWREGLPEDKRFAYETLHHVLVTLSKIMAPFAPFLSEVVFQNLSGKNFESSSVHLESYPEADEKFLQADLETAVKRMESLVSLGRNYREKIKVKAKIPLKRMSLIHRSEKDLAALRQLEMYFQDELNVREFLYDTHESKYVQVSAKAIFPVLGKRVGPKMKSIAAQIQNLSLDQIEALERGTSLTLDGEFITISDVEIRRAGLPDRPHVAADFAIAFEADPTVERDQELEGHAREILRKIQQARKNAGLRLDQRIDLSIEIDDDDRDSLEAIGQHQKTIVAEALVKTFSLNAVPHLGRESGYQHEESVDLDGHTIKVILKWAE